MISMYFTGVRSCQCMFTVHCKCTGTWYIVAPIEGVSLTGNCQSGTLLNFGANIWTWSLFKTFEIFGHGHFLKYLIYLDIVTF